MSKIATLALMIALAAPLGLAQETSRAPGGRRTAQPTPTPSPAASQTAPQGTTTEQPSAARSLSDRVYALLAGWQLDPAASALNENQQQLGATAEFKGARGLQRAQQGSVDEGLNLLRDAAAAAPADPAPEFYRGEVLYWQKRQAEANRAWQAAVDRAAAIIQSNPGAARAHYYRGAALVRLQRPAEARTALQKARDGGFDGKLVTFQVALSHFVQEQWDLARQHLDTLASLDSRFAPLYFYRGLAWNKLDRKDNMINDLDQFVKLAPNAPDAATARALLSAYSR
jgi:tetratricopeptide (TPR) repeat protein